VPQHVGDRVGGVAAGDAADVEPHAGPRQVYRPLDGVDSQQRVADHVADRLELRVVRRPAGRGGDAPEVGVRAGGDVERATALPGQPLGVPEYCEQVIPDLHRWPARRRMEPRELAL
jgi:hypothetical protein